MWFVNGEGLAEYASVLDACNLNPPPADYLTSFQQINGLYPLPAVIQCAENAKAITAHRARQLRLLSAGEDFSHIVGPQDKVVMSAAAMRRVPEGAVIAFIHVDPATGEAEGWYKGRRHLIHTMLSLGSGRAAGTQGDHFGLPVEDGNWRAVDLAASLNWRLVPGTYDAITQPLGNAAPLHMRIRYRPIAAFQENEPSWPEEETAMPVGQLELQADDCTIVGPGETWYVGPLTDCVGIAAIKPAGSLNTPGINKQIFLYHVNGGWVGEGTAAHAQLVAFLWAGGNRGDADWVFVHGASSKTDISITSFYRQPFYANLVEAKNTIDRPHIVRNYSGDSLQMNSQGDIVNRRRLIELPSHI
jgi:hypothetical protein